METKGKKNSSTQRLGLALGSVHITPGAKDTLTHVECLEALSRHARGDWGEVCDDDWRENDLSVEHGYRILSAYLTSTGTKFWIITEADRSATTILLPEEY